VLDVRRIVQIPPESRKEAPFLLVLGGLFTVGGLALDVLGTLVATGVVRGSTPPPVTLAFGGWFTAFGGSLVAMDVHYLTAHDTDESVRPH
jgi:hypothetical protein